MNPIFYVVATPIGNLKDFTYRAVETLQSVDFILCEDTRKSIHLLNHYSIAKKLISYNDHNKFNVIPAVIDKLLNGQSAALITDAGSPLISDPGYHLLQKLISLNIQIIPIPGCSAVTTALSAAGLPTDSFLFIGFLPNNKKKISELMYDLKNIRATIVAFESPNRIHNTLEIIISVFGKKTNIVIARELTKKFEEFIRGSVEEILANPNINYIGEMTLLINNSQNIELKKNIVDPLALKLYNTMNNYGIEKNTSLKIIAETFGVKKNCLYDLYTTT